MAKSNIPTFNKLGSRYSRQLNRFPAFVGQLTVYIVFLVVFNLEVLIGTKFFDTLGPVNFAYFFNFTNFYLPGGVLPFFDLVAIFLIIFLVNKIVIALLPYNFYSTKLMKLVVSFIVFILLLNLAATITFHLESFVS